MFGLINLSSAPQFLIVQFAALDQLFPPGDIAAGVGPTVWSDKNCTRMSLVGPQLLEQALGHCFPAIFTQGNMRSLKKRGAKHMPMSRILEYVEYVTTKNGTYFLQPEHRGHDVFISHFKTLCDEFGCRAKELVLEPVQGD